MFLHALDWITEVTACSFGWAGSLLDREEVLLAGLV